MAKKFSIQGLLKSQSVPLCILIALSLLLVLFAGTLFDEKSPSTTPEGANDEVKLQSRDVSAKEVVTEMRLPASQESDAQEEHFSSRRTGNISELAQKNKSLSADNSKDQAQESQPAAEEELQLNPQGTMYSEAQLNELDPETIRLVEEESRQGQASQPAVGEEEFDQKGMENALAEEARAIEEELQLNPQGTMYTEAQLNELDPETIRLVEEEGRQTGE